MVTPPDAPTKNTRLRKSQAFGVPLGRSLQNSSIIPGGDSCRTDKALTAVSESIIHEGLAKDKPFSASGNQFCSINSHFCGLGKQKIEKMFH